MYRTLLILVALTGVGFGLPILLVPDLVLTLVGAEVDDLGRAIYRELGAVITGYGVVAWFLRELDDGAIRRGVIAGVVISFSLTALILGFAASAGLINALGWVIAALHGAIAVGLALVLLRPVRASD